MRLRGTSLCMALVAVALALALATPSVAAPGAQADSGLLFELIHPQSDDQGHYVRVPRLTRATLFGSIVANDGVGAVKVNGRNARLFPAPMPPFGASADTSGTEFRVTLELRPTTTLTVAVEDRSGAVTHLSLAPDTEATVARLRELAAESPDDPRARCRLGNALKDHNQLKEAIVEFRAALERKSECAYTRVELGRALLAVGRQDEATNEFSLATEIDPQDPMAWLNLGLLHARYTRDTAEATRCFRRYLQLEPSSSIADKVRRYLERVAPGG